MCACNLSAQTIEKSQTVVYIGGSKYYVHTLEQSDTLSEIAELYGVNADLIEASNADFSTLSAGDNIKIPYLDNSKEEISGLQRLFSFNKHKVKKGDTLYSIARKYEISIDVILEDNPSLDPLHLAIGDKILIRKKMKGTTSAAQSAEEWEDYKEDLNMIAHQEDYSYHIVKSGETIYSLSRQAGMSEEEFISLNNLQDGLKAGAMVKMSRVNEDTNEEQNAENQDELKDDDNQDVTELESIDFSPLAYTQTLKIALLLPLSKDEKVNRQFAEFYNGFMMGLERVRKEGGRMIELMLFNTENSVDNVEEIVNSPKFRSANLIVGPIYEDSVAPVVEFAEQNSIPVISPLAKFVNTQSNVIFQLAPEDENRYSKIEDMLLDTKHITLVTTERSADSEFAKEVKAMLGDRPYATHTYAYEHPGTVVEKMRYGQYSPSNLTKLICNGKDNTVIVVADNETDVDRILSALSSAQVNYTARGGSKPTYRVLGESSWLRYKNIDHTILFKNNVTLVSTYQANRMSDEVKIFDSNYIKEYHAIPSLYTYRGYDAAVIFAEGMFSDIRYDMEGRSFTPLETPYRFVVDSVSGKHINTEWIKVDYNSDFTLKTK